jgi:hypothetical protein
MNAMANKEKIVGATVRLLLKPIARLCIRHSLKHQEVVEMLKGVLVQVAREELQKEKDTLPSVSKISLATGVHRKDVTRLERTSLEYRHPENIISKVMTQWQCDPRFTTKAGKPRSLSVIGQNSEFSNLVDSITGSNVSSYSVLFEMERAGILEKKGQRVKLLGRDLIHSEDVQAGLSVMAADANDLVAAVENNLFGNPRISHLHLRTEFDKIPADELERAREWILNEGSLFHKRIRKFLSSLDLDSVQSDSTTISKVSTKPKGDQTNTPIADGTIQTGRISIGTFSFDQSLDGAIPQSKPVEPMGGQY